MTRPARPAVHRWRLPALIGLLLVSTSACEPSFGWLHPITPQGKRMYDLWVGSCVAALVVGGFVWALILWSIVFHRKRSDAMPRQIRYNLPIEALYTAIPFVIVAGLFYYTAKDEIYVDKVSKNPQIQIRVVGFRWGWSFDYTSDSARLGLPTGTEIQVTGSSNTTEPVLVLPTGRSIQFVETSPDVIHSFWIPALLFKRDVIPGKRNIWEITSIDRTGTFEGHCAELCGVDHSEMNFTLKVVTPEEYDQFLASMKEQTVPVTAANTGDPTLLTSGSSQ